MMDKYDYLKDGTIVEYRKTPSGMRPFKLDPSAVVDELNRLQAELTKAKADLRFVLDESNSAHMKVTAEETATCRGIANSMSNDVARRYCDIASQLEGKG